MNKEISEKIKPIIGKNCCQAGVGEFKSLSLGFGEKIYHNNPKLRERFRGEWKIGTYYCAWRVVQNNKVLVGKTDSKHEDVLNDKIKTIDFGRLTSIDQLSELDIRISFDSGIVVDIFATISDDDEEYFHIFGPNKMWVGLLPGGKWKITKSDEPSS